MKPHSTKSRSAAPRSTSGARAIHRAFQVLRAFSEDHPVRSLADLTRAADLSKPTTLRLLRALEAEGMVRRDATGNFSLGPLAISLGALALESGDLRRVSRAELERLSRLTGETTSLEILVGDEIMVLDEVRGRFRGSAAERVGDRWPAHAAATGKVLLAALRAADPPAWRAYRDGVRGALPRFTAHTITSLRRMETELELVLHQGHALALEELQAGYVAIAAPIRDHAGRVVAAICLGGPADRLGLERSRLVDATTRAAAAISDLLGAPDRGRSP